MTLDQVSGRVDQLTDIDSIVAGLSKSQRKAILWCNEDGSPREHGRGDPSQVSFYCIAKVITGKPWEAVCSIYSLVKQGTGGKVPGMVWPATTWALTPLGLRVRAALEQGRGDG